jgi:cytochrome-b5 reductase
LQHVRRYATESPKSAGANTLLWGGVGAGVLGGGYYAMNRTSFAEQPASKEEEGNVAGKTSSSNKKTFTGGDQGFVSLVLEESEIVNHNTRKLRFKLPEEDMTSGLGVASALITKYKGPEMEKPVIRPYTPVSDEGMSYSLILTQCRG